MKSSVYKPAIGLIVTLILIYAFPVPEFISNNPKSDLYLIYHYGNRVLAWVFTYIFAKNIVNLILWDGIIARRTGRPVPALLKTMSSFLILFICATCIFTLVFDRSLTGVLAVGGGLSIILGLALQNMITDVFSGLVINIDRPFRIGDFIMLNNRRLGDGELIGRVVSINWRTTRLEKTDGTLVVIPNNLFFQMVVTNFALPQAKSRFELSYCIDFASDSERVVKILDAALLSAPTILSEPKPKVRVDRIDDKGVYYIIRYWIDPREGSPLRARHGVNSAVLRHLRFAGISLAYERNDIYFAPMPPRQVDFTQNLEALVARINLFKTLPEEGILQLSQALAPRQLKANETIVKAGEYGDSMYIIAEGVLEVFLDIEATTDNVCISTMSPGDYFGEMSLITGSPRSATVISKTTALIYEINKDSLEPLFESYPFLPEVIAQTVAERDILRESVVAKAEQKLALEDRQAEAKDQLLERIQRFFQL